MKKCIAAILAVCMAAAVSLPVLAAEPESLTPPSPNTNKPDGSYSLGVTGTYVPSGSTADETISVDISWETLNFTYTDGGSSYDPSTHLTTSGGGSWSTDKPGITVTNHSNAPIEASMSFAAASGVTTTGSFYTKGAGETYTAITSAADQKLSLATAAGTAVDNAPKGTLYFGVSGAPITESKTLGTITVKIEKVEVVYTGEALVAALTAKGATGGTITLGADVELPVHAIHGYPVYHCNAGDNKTLVLDLNGHTVTGMLSVNDEGDSSQVTVKNGTLCYANGGPLDLRGGSLSVENCTMTGKRNAYYHYSGNATFNGCTFNGQCVLGENGSIELRGTTVFDVGSAEGATSKGISVTAAGTVICHFDPTAYVDAGVNTVTNNGNGTWTVAARS